MKSIVIESVAKAAAVSISLVVGLVGCMSKPMKMDQIKEGNWKARALIRDKEQGRSFIVNLNFNLVRDERSRMDVTSALNTGVASLVADDKEVRYILFDSKRFYFGRPQADVMRPILSVPIDPRWIQNMLFDEAIPEKSWSCAGGPDGLIKECKDSVTGMKLTWSQRLGPKKTITIEHNKATVQINVQTFRSKVEDRKNLFVLEAPDGYQKLQVR